MTELIFNIDGGDKFFFDEFTINLPDDYDAKYFHKIEKKLNKNKGSPYSFKILENVLNLSLTSFLLTTGLYILKKKSDAFLHINSN